MATREGEGSFTQREGGARPKKKVHNLSMSPDDPGEKKVHAAKGFKPRGKKAKEGCGETFFDPPRGRIGTRRITSRESDTRRRKGPAGRENETADWLHLRDRGDVP